MTAGIWYHRRGSTLPMNPGSRAQGAIKVWGGLSMNRPLTPSLSPSEGERVPGGRVRGVVHGPNACEKRKGAFHEPPLSRPAATLSPPCVERAGRGVPIWFMAPIHVRILEVFPPHEPRSSRREEAHSISAEGSWSLLTSAATVRAGGLGRGAPGWLESENDMCFRGCVWANISVPAAQAGRSRI